MWIKVIEQCHDSGEKVNGQQDAKSVLRFEKGQYELES